MGFQEKLQNLVDKLTDPKTLVLLNIAGFGAIGYYLYSKNKVEQSIVLETKVQENLLTNSDFVKTQDPISVKNFKRRQNHRRLSMMIKEDKKLFVPKLHIPNTDKTLSSLVAELRFMDSEYYKIQRVPHLAFDTEITGYTPIINPLSATEEGYFVTKDAFVVSAANYQNENEFGQLKKYLRAGPKEEIFFQGSEVRALIVTCGGLCPGLNSVIREIVMCLWYNYGVKNIFGAKYGYKGIYNPESWMKLNPQEIKNIHRLGGTYLGSSRGGFNLEKILNAVVKHGINQIYVIGGDGTHQGVYEIYRAVKQRKLKIGVCGIPKTIDNDIPIIDCSFGYQTALEEATRAIQAAWVESHSHEYGVGVVKLMGRAAGWIAMGASYAARNVNICLIPEEKFKLYGENGLLEHVYKRLNTGKSCVIVVAEGAIEGCMDLKMEYKGTDASGNPILPDIASALNKEIVSYCKSKGMPPTLKYIDPSYMVRSCPPNAQDQVICSFVAQNAVHGAMFGFTGFSNGIVNGKNCLISLEDLLSKDQVKNIPQDNRQWRRFLISSGQPAFHAEDEKGDSLMESLQEIAEEDLEEQNPLVEDQ